jgi:hypothetical protein
MVFSESAADNARLPEPGGPGPTDDHLTYFDGTAWWLSWEGTYRGTWFNTEDFYGYPTTFLLSEMEMWFYHHSSYPWDTSDVYFEVYNGDQMAPVTQLDQTMVTATHYQAVLLEYYPGIVCEQNFWLIANTELSSGGWPAVLGDNTPNTTDHSFASDDFIVWEPWIIQGPTANDYWIQCTSLALEVTTWGAVKALF